MCKSNHMEDIYPLLESTMAHVSSIHAITDDFPTTHALHPRSHSTNSTSLKHKVSRYREKHRQLRSTGPGWSGDNPPQPIPPVANEKDLTALVLHNVNTLAKIFKGRLRHKNEGTVQPEVVAYYLSAPLITPNTSCKNDHSTLWMDWPQVRAASYRAIRYYVMANGSAEVFVKTFHLDYLMASDLDVISKVEVEKVQVLKLCFQILWTDPGLYPASLLNPIHAILDDGSKCKEMENMFQTTIAFMCEYVLLSGQNEEGSIRKIPLVQSLLASSQNSNLNTFQLIDVIVHTFCYSLTRAPRGKGKLSIWPPSQYLPIDIDPLISHFTSGLYSNVGPRLTKRKSCTGNNPSNHAWRGKVDCSVKKAICQYSLVNLLKCWPGFFYLVSRNDTSGLYSLIQALKMPFPNNQEAILEMMGTALYVPFPPETLKSFKDLDCWKQKRKQYVCDRWRLTDGFVASEICDTILVDSSSPIYPEGPNLLVCYQALVLYTLLEMGILEALMDVINQSSTSWDVGIKSCYLMGEIIKMGYAILPTPCQGLLTNLEPLVSRSLDGPGYDRSLGVCSTSTTSSVNRLSATAALNYLDSLPFSHSQGSVQATTRSPFYHDNVSTFAKTLAHHLTGPGFGTEDLTRSLSTTTTNGDNYGRDEGIGGGVMGSISKGRRSRYGDIKSWYLKGRSTRKRFYLMDRLPRIFYRGGRKICELDAAHDHLQYYINASGVVESRNELSSWNWKLVEYIVRIIKADSLPFTNFPSKAVLSDALKPKVWTVEKSPLWRFVRNVWNFFLPSHRQYASESVGTPESRLQTTIFFDLFEILWHLSASLHAVIPYGSQINIDPPEDKIIERIPRLAKLSAPPVSSSPSSYLKRLSFRYKKYSFVSLASSGKKNASSGLPPAIPNTTRYLKRLSLGTPAPLSSDPEDRAFSAVVINPRRESRDYNQDALGVGRQNYVRPSSLTVEDSEASCDSSRLRSFRLVKHESTTDEGLDGSMDSRHVLRVPSTQAYARNKLSKVTTLAKTLIVCMLTDLDTCLVEVCQEKIPPTSIFNPYMLPTMNSQYYFLLLGVVFSKLNTQEATDDVDMEKLRMNSLLEKLREMLRFQHTALTKLAVSSLFTCFQPCANKLASDLRILYTDVLKSKNRDIRTYGIHFVRACVRALHSAYPPDVKVGYESLDRGPFQGAGMGGTGDDFAWLLKPLLSEMGTRGTSLSRSVSKKLAYLTLREILGCSKIGSIIPELSVEMCSQNFEAMQLVCKLCGTDEGEEYFLLHPEILDRYFAVWNEKWQFAYPEIVENRLFVAGLGYEPNPRNRLLNHGSYFPWVKTNPTLNSTLRQGAVERSIVLVGSLVDSHFSGDGCIQNVLGNCDLENFYLPSHMWGQLSKREYGILHLLSKGRLQELEQNYLTCKSRPPDTASPTDDKVKAYLWCFAHLHRSFVRDENPSSNQYDGFGGHFCDFARKEICHSFANDPSISIKATAFYCLNLMGCTGTMKGWALPSSPKEVHTGRGSKTRDDANLEIYRKLANPFDWYKHSSGTRSPRKSSQSPTDPLYRSTSPPDDQHMISPFKKVPSGSQSLVLIQNGDRVRDESRRIVIRASTFNQPSSIIKIVGANGLQAVTAFDSMSTWARNLETDLKTNNSYFAYAGKKAARPISNYDRACVPVNILELCKGWGGDDVRNRGNQTTKAPHPSTDPFRKVFQNTPPPSPGTDVVGLGLLNYAILNEESSKDGSSHALLEYNGPFGSCDRSISSPNIPLVLVPTFDDYYLQQLPPLHSPLSEEPFLEPHMPDEQSQLPPHHPETYRTEVENDNRLRPRFSHQPGKCIKCTRLKFRDLYLSERGTRTDHSHERTNGPYEYMTKANEIKDRILNLISDSLSSFYTYKSGEQELLYLRCQYPALFEDACFYSDVSYLLANNNYHLKCRQLVQDLFMDLDYSFMLKPLHL